MRLRSLIGASALLITALATTLATMPAGSAADRGEDRIDEIAQANNMSRAKLLRLMKDDSFRIGVNDRAYYVDPLPAEPAPSGPVTGNSHFPLGDTFLLHSFPGSNRTIYLDFDGHTVSGTAWNTGPGSTPNGAHPAWDPGSDGAAFNDAEKEMVQDIFVRVAEDFAPFNVDVTTQDPGDAALLRADAADQVYGVRALISPSTAAASDFCGSACGGIAYLNVFHDGTFSPTYQGYYQPAWVFPHLLSNNTKYIAEATTHEVGHNLSLNHDGTSVLGYYAGQDNWAPIMGVGYYEPIVQWSKGDYTDANNTEDDIAAISAAHRAPFRADEAGDTIGTAASALPVGSAYVHNRTDKDVYALGTCTGAVTLAADPAAVSPNLDIQLRLLDSGGAQVAIADPPSAEVSADVASGMDADIAVNLPAGVYYAEVDGVGKGAPTASYDDYGSIGAYTLAATGCVAGIAPVVTLNPVDQTVIEGDDATFTAAATGTPDPTVQWQEDSGAGFADLPGATSTTLTLPNVTGAMDGNQYRAVFTNIAGSATTTAATLTVLVPICDETTRGTIRGAGTSAVAKSFYTQPGTIDACLTGPAGTDFDLYLQYQTRTGWVDVASSTDPGTSTETVIYDATQAGYYRWVVVSVVGSGNYTLRYSRP